MTSRKWYAGLLAIVAVLAAVVVFRSGETASTGANPIDASTHSSAPEAPIPPPAQRQTVKTPEVANADLVALPTSQPVPSAIVLESAEACLRLDQDSSSLGSVDSTLIWQCLKGLDWTGVSPADLSIWMCAKKRPLNRMSLVGGAALHARPAREALSYLAEYRPECMEVRETGLMIMAIQAIGRADPAWVAELEQSITPEALFTGNSSEQGILLAEYFIRRGNEMVAAIIEAGGRGEHGGSEKEIHRSASLFLFCSSTNEWDSNRSEYAWVYAESLLFSAYSPPTIGGVLASFLPSKQTWPGGDSTPAMKTMLLTLDDPRFKKSAAITLFATQKPEGPEGCNKALWDEIYKKVLAVAEENQWQLTGK